MYLGREQATGWRDEVKQNLLMYVRDSGKSSFLHFHILDPCDRWYDKGNDLDHVGGYVVQMDKMEIAKSDVVIVNATNPGWGTPMEQYIAFTSGKMVLAFSECDYPSVWAKVHSHQFFRDHVEAADFLCSIATNIARVV
jgi:hypothetical protein